MSRNINNLKKGLRDAFWNNKRMDRGNEVVVSDYKLGVLVGTDAVNTFGRSMAAYRAILEGIEDVIALFDNNDTESINKIINGSD